VGCKLKFELETESQGPKHIVQALSPTWLRDREVMFVNEGEVRSLKEPPVLTGNLLLNEVYEEKNVFCLFCFLELLGKLRFKQEIGHLY
jgi:hypothetical protein